ncbi:MAG: flavin reductase family protein [Actinomycetota bacterium]
MTLSPEDFRRALSRFASGVTVVTVEDERPHGMTASAFASVSLEPPLVLVCLDHGSRTRALLLEKESFAINVLSNAQEDVARAFSKRGTKPFDSLSHHKGETGNPLLDGALAWLECNLHEVVTMGDHDLVVGEVVSAAAADGDPLLYFDQLYRSLRDL